MAGVRAIIEINGPALATAGLATEGRTGPAQILLTSGKGCKRVLLLKAGLTLLTRVFNHYMLAVLTLTVVVRFSKFIQGQNIHR